MNVTEQDIFILLVSTAVFATRAGSNISAFEFTVFTLRGDNTVSLQEEGVVTGFTKEIQGSDIAVYLKVVIATATVENAVVAHTRSNAVDFTITIGIRIVDHLHFFAVDHNRLRLQHTANQEVVVAPVSVNLDGCGSVINNERVIAIAAS